MFEGLSEKLKGVVKSLRGHGAITEANIEAALREVRLALLEADVNFKVAKDFIEDVKKKALGKGVLSSVTPGEQFVKIVHDELSALLGGEAASLSLTGRPAVIMLVGLQGCGKTTTTAKLALALKKKGRNPYIVPADIARPAAVEQLKRLSADINVDCFDSFAMAGSVDICRKALGVAKSKNCDTVLIDTAGRLHMDAALMEELKTLKRELSPSEILLVADSMSGQDAVNTALGFDEGVGITGVILTKLDSDARGGAALSMRMATGKPIKFAGTGEKTGDLEVFHPRRLSGRILGMGDVVTLVEKAREAIEEKKAEELERKLKKDAITLEDFRTQLKTIKRMGSFESILSMVPGFDAIKKAKDVKVDEKELARVEAIINSMTPWERANPGILNAKRKIRVAKGSGTTVQDVNRLVKQFEAMKKMMKRFKKSGLRGMKDFLAV